MKNAFFGIGCIAGLASLNVGCGPTAVLATKIGIEFVASYLMGKAVDGIWDMATGRPDTRELDRRLRVLESQLSEQRPGWREPIQHLRARIHPNMSEREYLELAMLTIDRVADLERHVLAVQNQVNRVEHRVDHLEHRVRQGERNGNNEPQDQDPANDLDKRLDRLIAEQQDALQNR